MPIDPSTMNQPTDARMPDDDSFTDPVLSHTTVTAEGSDADRWLYLLHGIYGSGRNWASLARHLTEQRPRWGVILVDLRLHGGSAGFAPPHTVEACAADLARLEEKLDRPANALLGHSFGGKVALARSADEGPELRQVWVADSTLETGEPSGTAWEVVEIVRSLPDRFDSRDELVEAMVQHGYEKAVGQWLAMNLERDGGGFRWKLDWAGVEEMLRDYFTLDIWPFIESPAADLHIHVVKAVRSRAIDEGTEARLREAGEATGRVHLHRVEAGHWLNVDNPDSILDLLLDHLPDE